MVIIFSWQFRMTYTSETSQKVGFLRIQVHEEPLHDDKTLVAVVLAVGDGYGGNVEGGDVVEPDFALICHQIEETNVLEHRTEVDIELQKRRKVIRRTRRSGSSE